MTTFGTIGVCLTRHEKPPSHRASDIYFPKRNTQSWNSINGWPRGEKLFYECEICHKTLSSNPIEQTTCGCGNLFIGPDHIGAQTPSMVRLFEE